MDLDPSKRRPHNAVPIIGSPLSDPGLPALSSSPQSFFIERTQSLDNVLHQQELELGRSPSNLSEIEVILDDGTTQKRTVSLSTLPEYTEEEGSEDDDDDNSSNDKTPLLKSHKHASYTVESDSSDADGSDSDEPFFPVQHTKRKHQTTVQDDMEQGWYSRCQAWIKRLNDICTLTPQQRTVLKCSFAYCLGSLFTFVPALNALIGNNHTSSHLVATATVFFNPAKTLGGMVEAAAYGWGYVLFAELVSFASMLTTDFFVDRGQFLVAHLISLLFWLAGSTFIVAFLKAHWNKPPVATASSLCFIIIFIIVVREGSVNRGDFDTTRIEQITTAVATGTLITVACCVVFWPVSAAKKLKKDVDATLTSYRVLLKLLVKTFLLDDDLPEFKANRTLQTAIQSHQASFTALQKSLKEAKLETWWNPEVRDRGAEYDAVIKSMQRLAQHVGGLRSSCGIQFEIMGSEATKQYKEMSRNKKKKKQTRSIATNVFGSNTHPPSKLSQSFVPASTFDEDTSWNVRAGYRRRKLQDEMRRQKTFMSRSDDQLEDFLNHVPSTSQPVVEEQQMPLVNFIQTIRPPLKSFAYTCKQTIYHLQHHFSKNNSSWLPRRMQSSSRTRSPSLSLLKANLQKAIALFETAQKQAVQKLTAKANPIAHAETEAIGSVLGEEVILVYFFVFNMTEFARELITLVESVEKLNRKPQMGIFAWLMSFPSAYRTKKRAYHLHDVHVVPFVPNERNTINTLHTPTPKTKWRRFFIRVWRTFSLFKLQKIRYATKAMVAAILLATPAFVNYSQDWFRTYRMEWALITLMVVMTPTVGGTNLVAVYRIFSTALGCYVAMIFYMLFPGNMVVLALLTWLFSIPNFYLILYNKHGKFGQFTLLAYNLVMLNKYNDRDTNEIEVWVLANQRCFAILVGVVFGLIATAYVWPYEARVELRKGLSDFLLRLAWLYQKLVSIYIDYPVKNRTQPNGQREPQHRIVNLVQVAPDASETQLLTFESQRQLATQSFMDLELGLQRALLDLQALLSQTPNEPRLKGPFPVDTYRTMLTSCQNIVDRFLSMRTVMLKDTWQNQVQHDFMIPVASERKELVGNVLLYFYLLASALRLKTPMPPYFPPARKAWKSLLEQLFHMPMERSKQLVEKNDVYMFYYAYVTLMEDIIRELDKVRRKKKEENKSGMDELIFFFLIVG
ncbi:Fusaric acid resistance protein-like-domain-containing protein [Gilbertella persicaria]|uniref:Fusaric acid resistance protein-like-domain-containing protein n=1 Tax=Gilbertella persicaria TaxID=101096 RepID=UPI00221E855C|nr:Fusaric acid resistance protein-like-domain-containing protein [Gilbertella persicaria]KAI8059981.1 Fusaric acid resistance protein-like-domain-containing protein [Gilbertella persicaria]